MSHKTILMVAGEASGDRYGAALVRRLRFLRRETLDVFGSGGDGMQREGVRLLCHVRDLASIGPREAVAHLGRYLRLYRDILGECRRRTPDVAVLLDFPDFNLRLAKKLKRAGIEVIYYISPQLWAWRRGRIKVIRRFVDKMLVILPFEEEFYRRHGVDVEFVGHPLLEDFRPDYDRQRLRGTPRSGPVAPHGGAVARKPAQGGGLPPPRPAGIGAAHPEPDAGPVPGVGRADPGPGSAGADRDRGARGRGAAGFSAVPGGRAGPAGQFRLRPREERHQHAGGRAGRDAVSDALQALPRSVGVRGGFWCGPASRGW